MPTARKKALCRLGGCDSEAVAYRYCDDHLLEQMPDAWARLHEIRGKTEARVFTPPLRQLNRKTTRGYEVIDFAEQIGCPLLPWQKWVVVHAMELLPDESYRFKTILILVARQNGKSKLKQIVSLWRMYIDGARRIIGVAQDVALARDQMSMMIETIRDDPDLAEELGRIRATNGDEWFETSGCRYGIKALNRRAGRGGSNDEVNIDELREQKSWDGWAAVSKTTMARPKGQIWAMSNAGDEDSVVLNQLQANAANDSTIGLFEWSGEPDCALDDVKSWAQANPGLGHTVSFSAIRSALGTDPPKVFRTEVLCQKVDALDQALDISGWKAGADPAGNMDQLRDSLAACFDISPDERHCTLVVAAQMDDGRVRLEVAAAWSDTEEARTGTAETPSLQELLRKINPKAFGWYPAGPAAAFAPICRPVKGSTELTGGKVLEACQGLADLSKGRRIVHPDDPLLNSHVGGAQRLVSGDGWRFTRRGGGHCDAAYAVAGAAYLALTIPPAGRAVFRSFAY